MRRLVPAAFAFVLLGLGGRTSAETPLLTLDAPDLVYDTYLIPDAPEACRAGALLEFTLARPARVGLSLAGQPARTIVAGREKPLAGVRLDAGPHRVYVLPHERRTRRLASVPFVLQAQSPGGAVVSIAGRARDEIANRAVLPVGRTFVKGVDLLDGHLTIQQDDIKLEGRHAALQAVRTYSSAGPASRGTMGAGWSWSYERRLAALHECGLYAVQTADGGAQAFRPDQSGRLVPQRGYHTSLLRNRDGSYDFFDKAGFRHHFANPEVPGSPRLRLAYVEEPHGDRIALTYDGQGRLARVDEWHRAVGAVRTFRLSHVRVAGAWRVGRLEAWGLGLSVDYRYDRRGNLVVARGRDVEDPLSGRTLRYAYSAEDAHPHRLVSRQASGEARTEYRYFAPSDPFAGEAAAAGPLVWAGKQEFVKSVDDPAPGEDVTFTFDHTQAGQGIHRADVAAEAGAKTHYLLNADGNPLEIEEASGKGPSVWRASWDSRHVVKVREVNGQGGVNDYGYDERGNLTSDVSREKALSAPKTTLYDYDPRFNKLRRKQDPAGAVTQYEIHPQTGDLVRSIGPAGKVTSYGYTPDGCLSEEVEGGARTRYLDADSFCRAQVVVGPDGKSARHRHDARGRLRTPIP